MAHGAITWFSESRLAARPVLVDTRVTPCPRLTFACWCDLEVWMVRQRLDEVEQVILRRQLIAERVIAAAQRQADAWDEVEATSPYRLYVSSGPRGKRKQAS